MRKRSFVMFLLIALLLCGCATGHDDGIKYDRWNAVEHWRVDENGELAGAEPHRVDENYICSGCGAEVIDWGDGYVDVSSTDQYGNPIKSISYGPDGIFSEYRHEYEYDAQGNVLRDRGYADGRLEMDDTYVVGENGESRLAVSIWYEESGEYFTTDYDEYGNSVHSVSFDADGQKGWESWTEYTPGGENGFYESKHTESYADGTSMSAQYNMYKDVICREYFDAEGNLTDTSSWEYDYDEAGAKLWEKEYSNGKLIYEITGYAVSVDGDEYVRYPRSTIEYFDDGTRLETFYGPKSELKQINLYDADGGTIYTLTYGYEVFEDGNWKRITIHEGDKLVSDTEYVMDADGIWSRKAVTTQYNSDGTKTVTTFDENEEILTEVVYDANGNVIG
jgi:hypothetical protein